MATDQGGGVAFALPPARQTRHHLAIERDKVARKDARLTNDDELDDLVDGIRRRSDAAFRAVYEATADGLASFAYGMLGNRTSAEDAVQQAFLELVAASPGLRGDGRSLRVWLYRSVRYTCLDELRRRSRRPEDLTDRLPERYETPVPDGPPGLDEALAQLSTRQRSLLMLRHVAGLSPEEIARVSRANRGAVYAALARAEKRLRILLEQAVKR